MITVFALAYFGACAGGTGCARRADAGPGPAASLAASPAASPVTTPVTTPVTVPVSVPAAVSVTVPITVPTTVPRSRDGGLDATPTDDGLRILDPAGIRREIRQVRGRVLFVNFWATWCGPCLDELPLMDQFAVAARARGAVVLSISLDSDPRGIARIPALLRARAPGLTAAVARFDDPEQLVSLFSKSWEGTIPAMFAFDRAGRLKRSLIGEVEPADLDALMAELLPPSPRSPPRSKSPAARLPAR